MPPVPARSSKNHPPEVWKALLSVPMVEFSPDTEGARHAAWHALNRAVRLGDVEGARAALGRCGSPLAAPIENQKKLIKRCLSRRQWDLARVLIDGGVAIPKNPWAFLAKDDRLEDVAPMEALGLPIAQANLDGFMRREACGLAAAWMAAACPDAADLVKMATHADDLAVWFATALKAPPEVGDTLHRALKMRDYDPARPPPAQDHHLRSLMSHVFEGLERLWNTIVDTDDVQLASLAVSKGWVPPNPELPDKNWDFDYYGDVDLPLVWNALEKGSWGILAWWMGVPELKAAALLEARENPGWTWWRRCIHDPERLKWAMQMGVDVTAVDSKGKTLVHHMASIEVDDLSPPSLKACLDLLQSEVPGVLIQPDHEGVLPLDRLVLHIEAFGEISSSWHQANAQACLAHLNALRLRHHLNHTPVLTRSATARL